MNLQAWAKTDVGRQRTHNEDSHLSDQDLHLYVVADGMGGHAAGEVASALAVQTVRDFVFAQRELLDGFSRGDIDRRRILALLEDAIGRACTAVHSQAEKDTTKRGMGTTCSVLLLIATPRGDRGFIAHVGDSRVYLARRGQLHQLTEDHSLVNELVRRGKIKRGEIDQSPYRDYKNAVTRAVGIYERVEVDTIDFDVLGGDQFILCSDGLIVHVPDAEIASVLQHSGSEAAADSLIQLANSRGGHDNITTLVVRVGGGETPEVESRFRELNLKLERLRGMPIFRYLNYQELVRVLNITTVREVNVTETILREGTTGDELYILLEGRVALHKDDTFLTELVSGDHFGEMALVDREPRSATVVALEHTRLLSIRRKDFYDLVQSETQASVKLLWSFVQVLARRLRKTTSELSGARLAALALDMTNDLLDEPADEPPKN